MPKNSRPDIQVLEDRICRLKNQLLEYKGLRLYGVTKKRLSAVSEDLSECLSIIKEIVEDNSFSSGVSDISAFNSYYGGNQPEFAVDNDLMDTLLIDPSDNRSNLFTNSSKDDRYTPSQIVREYSQRISSCALNTGCSSGILQVNQFCQLLNNWYQHRFSPEFRHKDFRFKAVRIHEWIDLLMLAAGKSLNNGSFSSFISEVNSWIDDINTSKDELWPLPKSVMGMQRTTADSCTREAVLLEMIIKSELYDDSFYPEQKNSVKQIVISDSDIPESELDVDSIIQNSPKLIVTSSFNAQKYRNQ